VMACGELLPLWWKGVYLEAEKLTNSDGPKIGDRVRATAGHLAEYIRGGCGVGRAAGTGVVVGERYRRPIVETVMREIVGCDP
jgi:hypothetical protein